MAYCRKCGNQVEDNAAFCRSCGARTAKPVQNLQVLPPANKPLPPSLPPRADVIMARAMAERQHPYSGFAQPQTAPQYMHNSPNNVSVVVNTPQHDTGDVALMLLVESQKKSGWLAAFLNLVIAGAGYAYCGRWLLGIAVFLFVLAAFYTVGLIAWIYAPIMFIDGFLCAGRYNRELVTRILRNRSLRTR